MLLCLDPGPVKTAWLLFQDGKPIKWGHQPNHEVLGLRFYDEYKGPQLVIEEIVSYGMGFDKHLRDTIAWSGAFAFAWGGADAVTGSTESVRWVKRQDVKLYLCERTRGVNDATVRAALIDRYGGAKAIAPEGKCDRCRGRGKVGRGRARVECGRCLGNGKGTPAGVLHGIAGDVWSALSVAVVASEQRVT